jgi:AraC-like DNA-binding protein
MLSHHLLVRLCRARDLLRDPCGFELPIRDVAQAAALSEFHFMRTFGAVFGETPHQYRTRARMAHAKDLLATMQGSVTHVCFAVGFSSVGSFSTLFTRCYGEPPSVYRRRWFLGSRPMAPRAAPHCMSLLQAAWETQQFSRSVQSGSSS